MDLNTTRHKNSKAHFHGTINSKSVLLNGFTFNYNWTPLLDDHFNKLINGWIQGDQADAPYFLITGSN